MHHPLKSLLTLSVLGVLAQAHAGTTHTGVPAAASGTDKKTGTPVIASVTQKQRSDAAHATAANHPTCTAIAPFYWEIGDRYGRADSGGQAGKLMPAPTATTVMPIASASKWLFASYAVEQRSGNLSATDIALLNFRSGHTNFSACSNLASVASCLTEPGVRGGTNGDYLAATDGKFFYNGGHLQVLAANLGLGPDRNGALASAMQTVLGSETGISYSEPQLAGGVATSASGYAHFLQNLLNAKYSHMAPLLGSHAVCTHTHSATCPDAIFSPVNQTTPGGPNDVSEESWHYSLGHWVEDDPVVGDGAFSSPGRFGFYPWIDQSKTWYGVLARFDPLHVGATDPKQASYITSVDCGRLIRRAWLTGQAQTAVTSSPVLVRR